VPTRPSRSATRPEPTIRIASWTCIGPPRGGPFLWSTVSPRPESICWFRLQVNRPDCAGERWHRDHSPLRDAPVAPSHPHNNMIRSLVTPKVPVPWKVLSSPWASRSTWMAENPARIFRVPLPVKITEVGAGWCSDGWLVIECGAGVPKRTAGSASCPALIQSPCSAAAFDGSSSGRSICTTRVDIW
jgi:hypothetical protein